MPDPPMSKLSARGGSTALRDKRQSSTPFAILRGAALALLLVLFPLLLSADQEGPGIDKEVAFGVKMAQRGLWNEALFRFRRAAELRPGDGKILNNLAVAYEAVGQYENALLAYQEAVKVDAANRELKRNYSRFIEFYQAFKAAEEKSSADSDEPLPAEEEAEGEAEESGATPSSGGGQ